MYLKRYETNNGYRCSCCSNGSSDSEWIKEIPSFEETLDKAYDFNNNIDGEVELQYEKNGQVIYGYFTTFGRRYTRVYATIGDKSYQIVADNTDDKIYTRQEVLDFYEIFWRENCLKGKSFD